MNKQSAIPLVAAGVILFMVLVAPVSGGLVVSAQGDKILSRTGASSSVITVTDSDIPENGNITIDISNLAWLVANSTITGANVEVSDNAVDAVWTRQVEFDGSFYTLNLTSTGGVTHIDETVMVTFTGAAAGNSAWNYDTGDIEIDLTATRTDTAETSDPIIFLIYTAPGSGGLITGPGSAITTTDGATSMVITVTGEPILQHDLISVPVYYLDQYVGGGKLTGANVEISDGAAAATWTGSVDSDGMLTLTSDGGDTAVDETVTVTFTGAGSSPWKAGSVGNTLLNVSRPDNYASADFDFVINIPAGGGGLTAASGTAITTTTGAASVVITITGEPILQDGLITIPVNDLNRYVAGGTLTGANVEISDDATAATWTGIVDAGGILTLTSAGGDTAANENVTVTFTGAGTSPWKAGSAGTILLTASRPDDSASADFTVVINIPPPAGYTVVADFTGSPTTEIAPFTAAFTDTSTGNPTSWDWDWGDGTVHGTTMNPSHIYTVPGTFTVSLTASNAYSSDTATKYQYIAALNGGVTRTDTDINGLTVSNCGGPQTIAVDTSVLPADLIPDKFVLEIQPPANNGFKNITIFAQNGIGFTRTGNLITGSPGRVHLESADIAPPAGFSNPIGTMSSFSFSTDLPSYPCNAIISTKISEGILPGYDTKLQKIASGQTPVAVVVGNAYSATITRTNFPSTVPVKLRMSLNASWNGLLSNPGTMFLWRIADDGNSGQILPTVLRSTDTINNLDFYESDSPFGMSTFGLSSFNGNNNPFQLITLTVASHVESQNPVVPEYDTGDVQGTPAVTATQSPTAAPTPEVTALTNRLPESTTAKLYTNPDGLVTQATALSSADGFVTVTIGTGIVAKDRNGRPLASVTITPVPEGNLPGNLPGSAYTFAGRAYELQPDGAVFSPDLSLVFSAPADTRFGQDYSIQYYDRTTGTWKDVPGRYDPAAGTVTGQVSHFCTFALFAKTSAAEPSVTVLNTLSQPVDMNAAAVPPTAISTAVGLLWWVARMLAENVFIVIVLILLAGGFLLYERQQRRGMWK